MRYISIVLFLFSFLHVYAQIPVKIPNPKRDIRYIKFERYGSGFFRASASLPELVIAAIKDGRIKPYQMDLTTYILKPLTLIQWKKTIQIPTYNREGNDGTTGFSYDPKDFTKIGLDQTYGITADGNEIAQVHYVHFGVNESIFMQQGFCFSIKWEDFISVLTQTPYLFSSNCYGSWWNGNVLLTENTYTSDVGTWYYFMELYKDQVLPQTTSDSLKHVCSETILNIEDYYNNAGYLSEENKNGSFGIDVLTLNRDRSRDFTGCTFSWKEFQEAALKKSDYKKGEVFTYADAIRLKKFEYDDSYEDPVSENGVFISSGLPDPLCKATLVHSFQVPTPAAFSTLTATHLEELNLKHSNNALFSQTQAKLNVLIAEYVLAQSLQAYHNDSLRTVFTPDEVKIQLIFAGTYYADQQYKIGDSLEWKGKIYEVIKPMEPVNERSEEEFLSSVKQKNITSKDLSRIYILQLNSLIHFDTLGLNKKYELKTINLLIPDTDNMKGIDFPVLTVRWDELKKLLLADKRARVMYKGSLINMADLLEQRIFYTSFLKTGLLKRAQ